MPRCRCTDIKNANNDLNKLKAAKDHAGEALQMSKTAIFGSSGALAQLAKDVQNSATPHNISIFNSIESKLEQPVYDGIKKPYDKCVSRINSLPGEIRSLSTEDTAYHDALAAKKSIYGSIR